jgi:hypothetical protein
MVEARQNGGIIQIYRRIREMCREAKIRVKVDEKGKSYLKHGFQTRLHVVTNVV